LLPFCVHQQLFSITLTFHSSLKHYEVILFHFFLLPLVLSYLSTHSTHCQSHTLTSFSFYETCKPHSPVFTL